MFIGTDTHAINVNQVSLIETSPLGSNTKVQFWSGPKAVAMTVPGTVTTAQILFALSRCAPHHDFYLVTEAELSGLVSH